MPRIDEEELKTIYDDDLMYETQKKIHYIVLRYTGFEFISQLTRQGKWYIEDQSIAVEGDLYFFVVGGINHRYQ